MAATAREFASSLRSYIQLIATLVRKSQEISAAAHEVWREQSFLEALVTQGFRGGDERAKRAAARLSDGKTYSLTFKATVHDTQCQEPLTGADLALVVGLRIDDEVVSRRLILVQLKRADMSEQGAQFSQLHHRSGKHYFGTDLHQAERMLLFSDCSVYWLALPQTVFSDKTFLEAYTNRTNLAALSERRGAGLVRWHGDGSYGLGSAHLFLGGPLNIPGWEDLDPVEVWHWWRHFLPLPRSAMAPRVLESWKESAHQQRCEALLEALRAHLNAEASRTHGMRSRLPVVVAHAETVLGLNARAAKDACAIFQNSVPLPEFILGNVLSDDFGDENEMLIESMTKAKPDEYVRQAVRELVGTKPTNFLDPPVRAFVELRVTVSTGRQVRG